MSFYLPVLIHPDDLMRAFDAQHLRDNVRVETIHDLNVVRDTSNCSVDPDFDQMEDFIYNFLDEEDRVGPLLSTAR